MYKHVRCENVVKDVYLLDVSMFSIKKDNSHVKQYTEKSQHLHLYSLSGNASFRQALGSLETKVLDDKKSYSLKVITIPFYESQILSIQSVVMYGTQNRLHLIL